MQCPDKLDVLPERWARRVITLDQWHANEEVAWLAFEAGNYISNEGLEFQVGNLPVQGGAW